MTRFLITLPDAVELVLEALENGETGKIYVRRSPACTIQTLATAINELFNKKDIEYIGTKPGEKIHETLIADENFTSENTKQLNVEETKRLLLTLPEIKAELGYNKNK